MRAVRRTWETRGFSRFYAREYRPVLALGIALTGSVPLAEEMAQEAFLAAHRRWDRIARYDQPGGFVRRVVSNLAISAVRRRTREAAALERLFSRPSTAPEDEVDDIFWVAVRRLPRRQRQVLCLRYVEDMSISEIAAVLKVAEGTVKAHLHSGRQAVAKAIEVDSEEASHDG